MGYCVPKNIVGLNDKINAHYLEQPGPVRIDAEAALMISLMPAATANRSSVEREILFTHRDGT